MAVNDDTPGAKNKNSANTQRHKATKSLKAIVSEIDVFLGGFEFGKKHLKIIQWIYCCSLFFIESEW